MTSANFALTEFSEVRQEFIANSSAQLSMSEVRAPLWEVVLNVLR
jgi:hypothetical protein